MLHLDKLQSNISQLLSLSLISRVDLSLCLEPRLGLISQRWCSLIKQESSIAHYTPPPQTAVNTWPVNYQHPPVPGTDNETMPWCMVESLNPRLIKIRICRIYILWPDLAPKYILVFPPLHSWTMLTGPSQNAYVKLIQLNPQPPWFIMITYTLILDIPC